MDRTSEQKRSSWVAQLARIGIDAGLSQELSRQIAITNLFSVTIALITLPWAAIFWAFEQSFLSASVLCVSALCASSVLWNWRRRYMVSRLWLLSCSNVAIFGFAIALGPQSGVPMLFTATTCAPLALFDPKDHRGPFLSGVLIPVVLGAAAQWFSTDHAPLLPLSHAALSYLFPALLITTVIVLLFIVSYYYYVYERNRAAREREHRVEQARLDGALRESEQRYALASEGANDGLWEWSAKTDQVFYSERWKAMLGYAPSEIGERFSEWLDRVHPDDRARVRKEIDDHMVGRSQRLWTEHRMKRKNGSYAWMLSRGLAIRDRSGRALRMAGWMTDVTERRLAHERLAESEELFRQLVVQAADAIYFFDLDGHIRDVNQRAVSDLGYSREELLEMSIFDVDRQLTPSELRDLESRIPHEGALTLERVHTRKDARSMAVELRLALFQYRNQRHLLAAARDVSVRKEIEAQLMLADRMVSVGTLAAGVAHEINNPLTSLLLNLEFIERQFADLEERPNESFRQRLERALVRAREGAERVGVIVRDLKTFSRGDAEVRDAVDLRRVVESTLKLAHPELKRRALVRTELPPDLPAVRANEARLGQVFLNLLLNALQSFSREDIEHNQIVIRIEEEGDHVIADVIDNGSGMPEEVLARIFDPFFTTKPVGVGTGLGLYICRNIVESLAGTLSCESVLGRGTTFRIRLPTVRSLADGTSRFTPVGHVARPSVPPPPNLARARVLLIDDDPAVTQTLTDVLSGHEVDVARDVDEAIARLCTNSFDLVLCDIELHQRAPGSLRPSAGSGFPCWAFTVSDAAHIEAVAPFVRQGHRVIEKPVRSEALWELLRSLSGDGGAALNA